ncbi:MAG: hypothetical protein IPI41_10880, partial [Flavobacteriales bacterium]|nr:hypothetical protein [Flavobacteriales bacterium]
MVSPTIPSASPGRVRHLRQARDGLRQGENSGSVFNTILDMDGLAAGVYMVSVTVNDRVYQQ